MSDQPTIELPARLTHPDITSAQRMVLAVSDAEHAEDVLESATEALAKVQGKQEKIRADLDAVMGQVADAMEAVEAARATLDTAQAVVKMLAPAEDVETTDRTAAIGVGTHDATAVTTPNPDFHKAG